MIEPIHLSKPPGTREIRELTPEEVQSVAHVFAATGVPVPDLGSATFVGAVQDGKVLGFLVLQARIHAEPLWIEPGQQALFLPIVKETERVLLKKAGPQWVYLFAPAGKVAQMAASQGMQLEPWCVYSKLVAPELPKRPSIMFAGDEEDEVPFDVRNLSPASDATQ